MKIFDAHCDVLSKLLENPGLDFIRQTEGLDVTLERMREAEIGVQTFAIYLPERYPEEFRYVLESVDVFRRRVLTHPALLEIRSNQDLRTAEAEGRIGAILSLEGVGALQGNPAYMRILFDLGVRCVGFTWNYANWAADGVLEPRKSGFTVKGLDLIRECNELGLLLDVSHLSEKGFWELAERAAKPVHASHANAAAVSPRQRNLNDEQMKAIIQTGGVIGLAFVPPFLHPDGTASIEDLLPHLDHICSLGGSRHVGFGSDFDGIKEKVSGLEHAGHYPRVIETLLKFYSEEDVRHFAYGNWSRYFHSHLPEA
ncbi:dipeptidase [Cohnella caldifontis]|uniref:dipeptidase n=1 Tax=Cohnella caldifontis TaxID=3027471 RepID=UPI0023EC73D2|nr:dipeptidase [Cohnella sp. YIM B05605]